MDLKHDNQLIQWDAELAMKQCEERAEDRYLEKDYVISQFIKEFSKLAKTKGYIKS